MKRKLNFPGFSLIELLVVLGILAILMSIVLIAVNPAEQLNESADVSDKTVVDDFIKANVAYLSENNAMPWQKNAACNVELATGGTLASMPDCMNELVKGGKLETAELQSQQAKDIYLSKCGSTAVLCFNPKSKQVNESTDAKYDKYGNINPSCPLTSGTSPDCYVCHPILNTPDCQMNATPTPGPVLPTSTPTPIPTSTPVPSATPTLAPTPTSSPAAPTSTPLYGIGPYNLDDTKMLQTYIILFYPAPGFPPNYFVDISDRPDFGGTTTIGGIGQYTNGVPDTTNADTILWVAYAGNGYAGTSTSVSYADQLKLTSKLTAYISMPYEWSKYANGCGKTFYWRIVDAPNGGSGYTSTKFSPIYSNVEDCTTKVGVWTGVYWPPIDMNGDGIIDWTDNLIADWQTKLRAGGWQPPE